MTATLYTQSKGGKSSGEQSIHKVYETILSRYVAEIDPEKLAEAAITGMLSELDPYSQHINENNSHRLDAITSGEYGGVGIRLGRMDDSLMVISPMDGTPAFHQGIMAGDRIIMIDSVLTKKMTLKTAADMVRGEKGTLLNLVILRIGHPETLSFDLERELIKVPDVSYSGLLDHRIGFIKLANFSKYSAEELEKSIRKLDRTGLNGLVIDLRGNPGGLLSAALQSADLFIPKDAALLETRGRLHQANKKYFARRRPIIDKELPVAVLIDAGSASASEILAGILQDYDRAVLIGSPTYGKGLVQTVTQLTEDSRLKLTTAKYYLPSGRLIQKREIARDVLYEDLLDGQGGEYFSAGKRSFDAGEGVSPDLAVAAMPMADLERELWRKRLFFKYALEMHESKPGLTLPVNLTQADVTDFYGWLQDHDEIPPSRLSRWLVKADNAIDSTDTIHKEWTELRTQLEELLTIDAQSEFENNQQQILNALETELARVIGGNGARISASLKRDPVVAKAIKILMTPTEFGSILAGSDPNTPAD